MYISEKCSGETGLLFGEGRKLLASARPVTKNDVTYYRRSAEREEKLPESGKRLVQTHTHRQTSDVRRPEENEHRAPAGCGSLLLLGALF